jgi:hypothetical protein
MKGFSLFEVLVVLSLLMVVSLLGFSMADLWDHCALQNEVAALCFVIKSLHYRALATGREQRLRFTLSPAGYAWGVEEVMLPSTLIFGAVPGAYGPPSAPKNPIVSGISFEEGMLRCGPDGRLQAGAVYLCDKKSRWSYAITTDIGPATLVRRYRYNQSGWVYMP